MIPLENPIIFVYKDNPDQLGQLREQGFRIQTITAKNRTHEGREYRVEQEFVRTTSHYKLAILATICTMGLFLIPLIFNAYGIRDKIRGQRFIAVVIDPNEGLAGRMAGVVGDVLRQPPAQPAQVPPPTPQRSATPHTAPVATTVAQPSRNTPAEEAYAKLNTDFLQKNRKPHNPYLIKSILLGNPGIMRDILEGGEVTPEAIFNELKKIDRRVGQAEVRGTPPVQWELRKNTNEEKKLALKIINETCLSKYPEIKIEDHMFSSAFNDRPYIVQAIISAPSDADVQLTRMFPKTRIARDEIDRKRSLEKAFQTLKSNYPNIVDTDEAKNAVLKDFEGRTLMTLLTDIADPIKIEDKYNEIRTKLERNRILLPRKAEPLLSKQQSTPQPKPLQTAIQQPSSGAAAPAASTTQAAPSPTITPELSREQIQRQLEAKKIERGSEKQTIIDHTLNLWAVKENINMRDQGKLDKVNLDFERYIPNVNPDLYNNGYYKNLLCRLFDKKFKQQKPETDVEKLISNLIAYIRDHRDAKHGRPVSIFNLNNLKPVIQEIEKMHPGLLDVSEIILDIFNLLDSWNNSAMMTSKVELVKPDTAPSNSSQVASAAPRPAAAAPIQSAPPITPPRPPRTGKQKEIFEKVISLFNAKTTLEGEKLSSALEQIDQKFEEFVPYFNEELSKTYDDYNARLVTYLENRVDPRELPKTTVLKEMEKFLKRDSGEIIAAGLEEYTRANLENIQAAYADITKHYPGLGSWTQNRTMSMPGLLKFIEAWNKTDKNRELFQSKSKDKGPAAAAPPTEKTPTAAQAAAAASPTEQPRPAATPVEVLQRPLSAVAEGKKPATLLPSSAPNVIDQAKYEKVKEDILKVVKEDKRLTKKGQALQRLPVEDHQILEAIERNKNFLHPDLCENSNYIKLFGLMIGNDLIKNHQLDFIGREKPPLETSIVRDAILKEFVDGFPKILIHNYLMKSTEAWTEEYRKFSNPKLKLDNLELLLNEIIKQNPLIAQIDSSTSFLNIRPILFWAMELAKKRNIQLFEDMPGPRVVPTETVSKVSKSLSDDESEICRKMHSFIQDRIRSNIRKYSTLYSREIPTKEEVGICFLKNKEFIDQSLLITKESNDYVTVLAYFIEQECSLSIESKSFTVDEVFEFIQKQYLSKKDQLHEDNCKAVLKELLTKNPNLFNWEVLPDGSFNNPDIKTLTGLLEQKNMGRLELFIKKEQAAASAAPSEVVASPTDSPESMAIKRVTDKVVRTLTQQKLLQGYSKEINIGEIEEIVRDNMSKFILDLQNDFSYLEQFSKFITRNPKIGYQSIILEGDKLDTESAYGKVKEFMQKKRNINQALDKIRDEKERVKVQEMFYSAEGQGLILNEDNLRILVGQIVKKNNEIFRKSIFRSNNSSELEALFTWVAKLSVNLGMPIYKEE